MPRFLAIRVSVQFPTFFAVLLAEQNLVSPSAWPNGVYVLESGDIRLTGNVADLAEKQELRALLAL